MHCFEWIHSKKNLLINGIVRDHLVLGGTIFINQTAHVVLETANGRFPELDLGLILWGVGTFTTMSNATRSRMIVRIAPVRGTHEFN